MGDYNLVKITHLCHSKNFIVSPLSEGWTSMRKGKRRKGYKKYKKYNKSDAIVKSQNA